MSRILVVDDEVSIGRTFQGFLSDDGHTVELAATAEEGLELAENGYFDALVLDIRLPGIDGISALAEFKKHVGSAPVVIITAFGNLETAVRALEEGAFDYLVKPFDLDEVSRVIKRALASNSPLSESGHNDSRSTSGETLVGRSAAMQYLFKSIALVAPTDVPVLITGESGTGKELVARAIHRHSTRSAGPFLPVCAAALSPSLIERELFGHVKGAFTGADRDRQGLLELARGGTILLDELGDIPLPVQVKMLRAIEHREVTPVGDARPRPVDFRIIAATNRPLESMMANGQFREDLFFRLNVFPVHIPPLRDRREDIPLLAQHFLTLARPGLAGTLGADFLAEIQGRRWVGNVRELRNAIERAVVIARGSELSPEHLPMPMTGASQLHPEPISQLGKTIQNWVEEALKIDDDTSIHEKFLATVEPPLLLAILKKYKGNRAEAANRLGIHRATLRQKLKDYHIDPDDLGF